MAYAPPFRSPSTARSQGKDYLKSLLVERFKTTFIDSRPPAPHLSQHSRQKTPDPRQDELSLLIESEVNAYFSIHALTAANLKELQGQLK